MPFFVAVLQVRVHTDITMSIISIPQRSGIATSALDHRVLLWDMDRCKVTRELDANGAPIEKLLNVRPLDLLLGLSVSGELIGWDLGMGEKCLVLNGHATKVVDIALVGMVPPRAVTMDSGGNVKLWELSARSGLSCPCIISFAVERLEGFQSTLCTMTAPQRLRGAGCLHDAALGLVHARDDGLAAHDVQLLLGLQAEGTH